MEDAVSKAVFQTYAVLDGAKKRTVFHERIFTKRRVVMDESIGL